MSQVKDYLTFTKGIITDASPLSFPENSSIDELNCMLYRDGSRQRRLGLDLEDNSSWTTVTNVAGFRWNVMEWEGAGGEASNRFIVVQAGNQLFFFDGSDESFSNKLKYTYTFPEPSPVTTGLRIEGVSVMGDFVVTSAGLPIVFKYFPATDTFTFNYIQIVIRDIFGVVDSLAVDQNPVNLTVAHKYNLLNQGWSKRPPNTSPTNASSIYTLPSGSVIYAVQQQTLSDAYITQYKNNTGFFPDNTQVWWAGKNSDDDFSPNALDKIDFGTTAAPRGRVVLDAFNRGASRKSVFPAGTTLPNDYETGRPTTLCFAFQRIWYSGVKGNVMEGDANSPIMTGFVFFSRTLRNHYDLGLCMPAADPCSEYDADIVDTDGGFVNIPDSGQIYALVNINGAIIVVAQFGVWAIKGGDNGFTASDFSIEKITDFGATAPESIVAGDDAVFYWTDAGIYVVTEGQGGWTAQNLTDDKIGYLIESIPPESKRYLTGQYDPINKRLSWLFNITGKVTGFVETYDNELVFDMGLGAFYRHSYFPEEQSLFISGYALSKVFLKADGNYRNRQNTVIKYLVVTTETAEQYSFSFAYPRNKTFHDFPLLIDGNYSSYLITGYEVAGLPSNKKYSPYLVSHFRRTETATENEVFNFPSSCLVQARWDWSGSPASGKWGTPQQAYRLLRWSGNNATAEFDYGTDVVTTKLRLGGSGKALSLKFESEEGKDFHLYGWSISASANPVI